MQVTVVIPTYKRLDYLRQALDSVCQQTFRDFTCLVVNDYPPDTSGLKELIASFNDDRLRLINHEVSGGGNAARNTGIRAAESDIIAFLDDDDCWLPQKLERHMAKHLANPQVGLVYSGVFKCWTDGVIPICHVRGRLPTPVLKAMRQGTFCPPTTSAVTVRRECFINRGLFDSNLASFQDWDMWYRLADKYDFDYIEDALVIFRQHTGDRTSRSKERRLLGLKQIIAKWQLDLDNPQQFEAMFVKDTYLNSVYDLILGGKKKAAFQDWYTLLKLSKNATDFAQLTKLMIMWSIGAKNYGRIFKSAK